MRRKAFDSTLFKRAVCVEPPHTWDTYSIQGRISPLYIVSIWEGEQCCWRLYRMPNFEEADLAREKIWNFQLRSLDKDRPSSKPSRGAPVNLRRPTATLRTEPRLRGGKRINPRPLNMEMSKYRVLSLSAEGMSTTKSEILANLDSDIICLQETHRDSMPPGVPGMHLIIHHPSPIHGSAIYAQDKSAIKSSADFSEGGIEILQVGTVHFKITCVYKPPATPFRWSQTLHLNDETNLVVGDFNSHSTTWGYSNTNRDGEAVKEWAASNDLSIVYDAKHPATFQSARWRRGYNPDLALISTRHYQNIEKSVGDPIPRTQHRPIVITIRPVIKPQITNLKQRFNFRKTNWGGFASELEAKLSKIPPTPDQY